MSSGPSLSVPISLDYFCYSERKQKKKKNETKERSKYEVPATITAADGSLKMMEGEVIISIQIQKVKMRTACLTNPLLLLPRQFKKKRKKDVTWDDHQTMWSSFSSRKLLIEGTV